MVLYIDFKRDRRTVAVRIKNVEIIGASFCNGSDGTGIYIAAFDGIPVGICPFIGEAFHIIGRNSDVQIGRCIGGNPESKVVRLLSFTIFCICCIRLQVVLHTDIKIDRSTVAVLVIDSESIISVFCDRSDSTGSGAGAFDGIAVVVCPFIGETVHVISSYGDIQVN